jgi:hypothetical protein
MADCDFKDCHLPQRPENKVTVDWPSIGEQTYTICDWHMDILTPKVQAYSIGLNIDQVQKANLEYIKTHFQPPSEKE